MSEKLNDYFRKREEIGERFRIFRLLLQKSQEDFSNETLREMSEIQRIENGTFIPDIEFIGYFCDEYGLNIIWLVYGKENIFYKETTKTPRHLYDLCLEKPSDIESLKDFLENFAGNQGYIEHG
jgi:transcriptional regulator with XRE-family HTH domain